MKEKTSQPVRKKNSFLKYMSNYYQIYLLMLPAIIFIAIFCYYPMYGAQIAFRDYKFKLGFWGSEWVGLKHFARFVTSSNFWPLFRNTLLLSLYSLVAGFPAPIILAFLLNEMRSQKFKRVVQMLTYIPHFMSTVAICGLILLFVKRDTGIINQVIVMLGGEAQDFITDPGAFRTIYVLSGVWAGAGWGSIIYLAALSGVDSQIIEAARIDGANRLQKIIYIDFPSILPTIIILLVLNCGSLLSVGFEKVLLLQNQLNMETSDVISTYVYRIGILDAQYSYTTAIGLFNSVVNVIVLVIVNTIAGKLSDTSLW